MISQLASLRYELTPCGLIAIEKKEATKLGSLILINALILVSIRSRGATTILPESSSFNARSEKTLCCCVVRPVYDNALALPPCLSIT